MVRRGRTDRPGRRGTVRGTAGGTALAGRGARHRGDGARLHPACRPGLPLRRDLQSGSRRTAGRKARELSVRRDTRGVQQLHRLLVQAGDRRDLRRRRQPPVGAPVPRPPGRSAALGGRRPRGGGPVAGQGRFLGGRALLHDPDRGPEGSPRAGARPHGLPAVQHRLAPDPRRGAGTTRILVPEDTENWTDPVLAVRDGMGWVYPTREDRAAGGAPDRIFPIDEQEAD